MIEAGYNLKIDPEFRRLAFPCSPEEYAVLEQQILQHGCSWPIAAWYGYIIRGFEEYEICRAYNIEFEVKNINFRVREEIISFICREELSSGNLPENQYRYLIGKRYNADIIVGAHHAAGTDQFKERVRRELSKGKKLYESSAGRTKARFAREYHLSPCSVIRYSVYAKAIDHIASIKPEIADRILSGETKTSMESVMACYGKTEKEVMRLLTGSRKNRDIKKSLFTEKKTTDSITIKDMPVFDPDAEINSLALTIPSWISSIERTRSTAKFELLTSKGQEELEQKLYQLQRTVEMMLHDLKEVR